MPVWAVGGVRCHEVGKVAVTNGNVGLYSGVELARWHGAVDKCA